jgi:hypothetical protein
VVTIFTETKDMSSGPQDFRLTGLRRALRAAREAGIVGHITFDINKGILGIKLGDAETPDTAESELPQENDFGPAS